MSWSRGGFKWRIGAGSSGACAQNVSSHAWCWGQQIDDQVGAALGFGLNQRLAWHHPLARRDGTCPPTATNRACQRSAVLQGELRAYPTLQPVPGNQTWFELAAGAGGGVCGVEIVRMGVYAESKLYAVGGDLYCWGSNRFGLFGSEHAGTAFSAWPLKITWPGVDITKGDFPGELHGGRRLTAEPH